MSSDSSYAEFTSLQLFIHNLELLGLNSQHDTGFQRYHQVALVDTLFTSENHHNSEAFEWTSYFLFDKLDREQTRRKFASCWPVCNRLAKMTYCSLAYGWLMELIDQQHLSNRWKVSKETFDSCQGDLFISSMLLFSVLVLQIVLERDYADPNGKPIRLLLGYPHDERRSRTFSLENSDTAAIEQQLRQAIKALAKYSQCQVDEFKSFTKGSVSKVSSFKQHIQSQMHTLNTVNKRYQQRNPSIVRIRDQLRQIHQAQHQSMRKLSSRSVPTPRLSTTPVKEQEKELKGEHAQSSYEMADEPVIEPYTLPSLLRQDYSDFISKIHDFVRHHPG